MANIEIDRVNKMLYTNLTSIASSKNNSICSNPLVDKSEQIKAHMLTRRRHHLEQIEKANMQLLNKL